MKQIIAIGGGGFGRNPNQRVIEKYIIEQSNIERPNVLFIPTASAEDKSYIVNFYSCFNGLNCNPSHLNFFQRTPRIDSLINSADIIYVGGGNTKSMLAVWREWKLDKLLMKAYKKVVKDNNKSLKNTILKSKGIFCLPLYPNLKISEMNKIVNTLNKILYNNKWQ